MSQTETSAIPPQAAPADTSAPEEAAARAAARPVAPGAAGEGAGAVRAAPDEARSPGPVIEEQPDGGAGDAGPSTRGAATAPADAVTGAESATFTLLFWVAVLGTVAISVPESRAVLERYWQYVTAGVVLSAVVVAVLANRSRVQRSNAAVRAGLVLGLGLPALALLVVGLPVLEPPTQLFALRGLFMVVVIFTPTVMWWLFVAAQRESLLNEFLANLDRLGLLDQGRGGGRRESAAARRTRVSSYLQKFEANFVRVPGEVWAPVTEGAVAPYPRDTKNTPTPLATTAVPVFLTLLVMAIGWMLTLPPTELPSTTDSPVWLDALVPNLNPVTAAFLGAYFFSMQMLFRRYVRRDLRGSAYVAVVMRVVLAVIGIWVIVGMAQGLGWDVEGWQMLTAGFVVGVFPKVAWQLVQGVFAKISHRLLPAMESRLPLSELDGLTVWHEARLEEEDIENVPNMATADLVELLVSTRFPADRLIDWVDQAILLTQLGPDEARTQRARLLGGRLFARAGEASGATCRTTSRDLLAAHGIRNASNLVCAYRKAQSRGEAETFDALLTDAHGRPVVGSLVEALGTNCNLYRILRWRGMD